MATMVTTIPDGLTNADLRATPVPVVDAAVVAKLPAALTTAGNLKVSIEEGAAGGGSDASAANQTIQIARLDSILTELGQKLEAGQAVALDAGTLAALENITATIAGGPTDYPNAALLAKLEAVRLLLAAPLAVNVGLTDAQLRASSLPGIPAALGPIAASGRMAVVSAPFDHTGTVSLSATSASANVALPGTGHTMIVRNYGPNRVFVKRGGSGQAAAITDYPVEAYTIDYLYRDPSTQTYLAAICANSGETASLSINCGEGGD